MSRDNGQMNGTPTTLRNTRSMPQWVSDQSQVVGPKPPAPPPTPSIEVNSGKPPVLPPKKMQPDPDYEVIEFGGQQYSNSVAIKSSNTKRADGMKCDLCGSLSPKVKCEQCNNQLFCGSCDDMFHRHPKRKSHNRKTLEVPQHVRPPLPPKADSNAPSVPVPPPRRNKKSILPSPFLGRKDQNAGPKLEPPPSPSLSIRDRLGSVRKVLSPGTRPLPDAPSTTLKPGLPPPRPTTPGRENAFDSIQKPPSLAMERIKNQTTATLDRMSILQQRYRQHQELMRSGGDHIRRTSIGSQNEDSTSNNRYRYPDFSSSSDQWSNPSLNRLRSGSMSSGMNTLTHGQTNNRFHMQEPPPIRPGTRASNMSNSVFDLNHIGQRNQRYPNSVHPDTSSFNQPHIHTTCLNCSQQQLNWNPQIQNTGWDAHIRNLNGSNMSLNLPSHGYYPGPHGWGPPPMYPYPVGMFPVMGQGVMPVPPRSRAPSRSNSRAPSPALSIKSRKSTISSRNVGRGHFIENELTDDEESDSEGYLEDIRSSRGRRQPSVRSTSSRGRPNSTSGNIELEDNSETFIRSNPNRSSIRSNRERRGSSSARSIQGNWPTQAMESVDRARTNRHEKRTIISDSPLTPDSESESAGTKALVQAKIREKLAQQSSIDESSSDFWKGPQKNNIEPPINHVNQDIRLPTPHVHDNHVQNVLPNSIEQLNSVSPVLRSQEMLAIRRKQEVQKVQEVQAAKEVQEIQAIQEVQEVHEAPESQKTSEPNADPPQSVDEDYLGPPPSTPEQEWECQFCTFVNEAKIKICAICCKTQIKSMAEESIGVPNKMAALPPIENEDSGVSDLKMPNDTKQTTPEQHISTSVKSATPSITKSSANADAKSTNTNTKFKQKSSSSSDGASKDSNGKIKGKNRKISFWPGTKSK